jgi:hypothetical protein
MLSVSTVAADAVASLAADADYVLGETGDTVIYIFPGGEALMNRDAEIASAVLAQHEQPCQDTTFSPVTNSFLINDDQLASTPTDEADWVDRLLAEGKLTIAQIQVGRYDQETTGISLAEALTLRGWI